MPARVAGQGRQLAILIGCQQQGSVIFLEAEVNKSVAARGKLDEQASRLAHPAQEVAYDHALAQAAASKPSAADKDRCDQFLHLPLGDDAAGMIPVQVVGDSSEYLHHLGLAEKRLCGPVKVGLPTAD